MERKLSRKQIRYKMPYRLIMFLKKHKALGRYINIIYETRSYYRQSNKIAMLKYISMSIYITLDLCNDPDQEFWLNIYCSDEFKNFIKEEKEKQKQERCGLLLPLW